MNHPCPKKPEPWPRKKILLFPEMRVTKNIFIRAAANFFVINLNFLNKVYAQRTTLTTLFFVETQRVLPFIVRKIKNVNSYE